MLRATVAWHIYDLTGSKVLLGMLGLAQFIPAVIMALTGGIVADRTNRTAVVRWCQIAVTWIGPALIAGLTEAPEFAQIFLFSAVAIVAGFGSFESPSRAALLVSLVSKKEYPRAVTRAATVHALAFASGPTIAGFVIAAWGTNAAYAGHTLLMLLSIALVSLLPAAHPEGEPTQETPFASLVGGFRYVLSNRIVLACMALDMLAVMLGGASALLPVFAEDILQVGPRGYGFLSASMETGALLMSLYLAWRRPIRSAGAGLILSVIAYGVVTIVFGASRFLPLSIVAYALVGAADQISVVLRHTTVQMSTDDRVRGRVSSINMLFIHASNQLGALESGLLAAAIGAPAAVMFGGAGAIAVAVVIALAFPALRRYRIEQDEEAQT